jgi:hypothetical protein
MKRKRHSPEQIIRKLREAEAMLAAEKTIGQVPVLGGERADLPSLAESVRRDEGRGGQASQGVGGREQASEEALG